VGLCAFRAATLTAAIGLVHCRPAPPAARSAGEWDYVLTVPPAGSWKLGIEAVIERAPVDRLVSGGLDSAFADVSFSDGEGAFAPATRDGGGWRVPACRKRCRLRYTVDLDRLSAECRLDCARRVGEAVLGQASAWMLRPEPPGSAVVRVRLGAGGAGADRYATGLRRDGSGFVFRSEDLNEASYTAIGSLRRAAIDVGGARIDVVLLGSPIAMGDAAVVEWIRDAAGCVASISGRFPLDTTVFVVPVAGADEVLFGRVMSLAGGSVMLLFGEDARSGDAHVDWVVVHELFHLLSPSYVGEGHWLEEGIATYYEPILRERAGWISEAGLWTHFVRQMPRGLRKPRDPPGLEDRDDIDSTYWGGALFALLADVKTRAAARAAGHSRSLDDAVRAMTSRYGDATHRATVADFIRTGGEATGVQAIAQVFDAWAVRGEEVDLPALWSSLGVEPDEKGVTLHDDAPLADVRKAIASGAR
jgi:predicted metalloprotease with PDZ domain